MVTHVDEGKGCVKTHWDNVRKRVVKVEPQFAKIVDELNPGKDFPLYLIYYPYGALKGDTESPFIPNPDGTFYRLSDPNAPKEIIKDLGYGKEDAPLGLVLEKNFEFFIDLKGESITIPKTVYAPGSFLSYARNLGDRKLDKHSTNKIFSTSSGARSTFMLPNIECATNHDYLQRDFNISMAAPKSLYQHWEVFRDLAHSYLGDCNWRGCILYFSENWINKLHQDKSWQRLKLHLHERAWRFFEYERSRYQYEILFSILQKKLNLKPNPYVIDTVKHLFAVASGAVPGYAPVTDEESLPLEFLQKSYVESYGLKKYIPTMMAPSYLKPNENLYYSLAYPSTYIFSPKTRAISNTLSNLRMLSQMLKKFVLELSMDDGMCADSIMAMAAKNVQFNYFHNETDLHRVIRSSAELPLIDSRFDFIAPGVPRGLEAKFSSDARFVRGCVSVGVKKQET